MHADVGKTAVKALGDETTEASAFVVETATGPNLADIGLQRGIQTVAEAGVDAADQQVGGAVVGVGAAVAHPCTGDESVASDVVHAKQHLANVGPVAGFKRGGGAVTAFIAGLNEEANATVCWRAGVGAR